MSLLTADRKSSLESAHYVILRTNVGNYLQGKVVTGVNLGADNIQRLLDLRAVREATDLESGFDAVDVFSGKDEEATASFQERISRLEAENNRLRNRLGDQESFVNKLQSEAKPQPPSQNMIASMALLKAKEDRIMALEHSAKDANQRAEQALAENAVLLQRLEKQSPPPANPLPLAGVGTEDQKGRKTR